MVYPCKNQCLLVALFVLPVLVLFFLTIVANTSEAATPGEELQLLAFDMENLIDNSNTISSSTLNSSQDKPVSSNSSKILDDANQAIDDSCDMPPCPPGEACIQSCP